VPVLVWGPCSRAAADREEELPPIVGLFVVPGPAEVELDRHLEIRDLDADADARARAQLVEGRIVDVEAEQAEVREQEPAHELAVAHLVFEPRRDQREVDLRGGRVAHLATDRTAQLAPALA